MRRLLFPCIAISLSVAAITNGQFEPSTGGTIRKLAAPPGGPGSSFAKAIIITASDETKGIGSEYQILSRHFPGATAVNHRREYYTKRTYDVITFTTGDGQKRALYFDYRISRQ